MENSIKNAIKNPGKSETFDDVEKTIANQMSRFTKAMVNSDDKIESLKMVCALGFDLVKTCGMKVCEDTNMILAHIIRKQNPNMAIQFQQIANNSNNNDICIYLYLALPTIGNKVDKESLVGLCLETIDKISLVYDEIGAMTNYKSINVYNVKKLYKSYNNE